MKTRKLLLCLVMVTTSLSMLAQSKGEMPFSGSPEANKLLRKSWVALGDFNLEEGNEYSRQVLAQDPEVGMAYVSFFTEDDEELKERVRKAEEARLSADERMFIEGLKLHMNGQSPRKYFDPLLEKYPDDHYLHLWIMINSSDPEHQTEIGEEMIKRNPKFAPAYNLLGYVYMNRDDMEKAQANFDKYISLRPDLANPYDSKGDYMMRAGRFEEAVPLYEKAFALGMTRSARKVEAAKARMKFPNPSEDDAAKIKEMIHASIEATKEGDVDALLKDYSEQSVEIFGNQIVNVGLPNLQRRVAQMFKNGSYLKQEITIESINGAGPIAVAYGKNESVWKLAESEKEHEGTSNVIFLLHKQDDGQWKILADHFYESDAQPLSSGDKRSINQLLHRWDAGLPVGEVITEEHLDSFTSLYTPQAIEIVPNLYSNVGLANLRARWEQYKGNKMKVNALGPVGVEGFGRRAVAWGAGNQHFYHKETGELIEAQFPWAMILTKEQDDVWRILLFHWGSD